MQSYKLWLCVDKLAPAVRVISFHLHVKVFLTSLEMWYVLLRMHLTEFQPVVCVCNPSGIMFTGQGCHFMFME